MSFTPNDVVARYRELGLTADFGAARLTVRDGRIALREGVTSTCALGAMAIGAEPVGVEDENLAVEFAQRHGLMFWPFVDGFDTRVDHVFRNEEEQRSFELGRACRVAVLEAGLTETEEL